MEIKGVIFDLFHTLVDPEDFRPRPFKRVKEIAAVLRADVDDFNSFWTESRLVRNTTPRPLYSLLLEFADSRGLTPSRSDLQLCIDLAGRYQEMALMAPRPEVIDMLRRLRELGLRLAILSVADLSETSRYKESPLSHMVDVFCLSWETGLLKPHADSYRMAAMRLGLETSQCAFVGDGGSDELAGAKAAGIGLVIFMASFIRSHNFWPENEFIKRAEAAHHTANSMSDLLDIVGRNISPSMTL